MMTTLIAKARPYVFLSYTSDITRVLAIEAALNESFPTYLKYTALSMLIPPISIRYAAHPIDQCNDMYSKLRQSSQEEIAGIKRHLEQKLGPHLAPIAIYFIEHEISANLMWIVMHLIVTAYITVLAPYINSGKYIDFDSVHNMQLTLLILASLKFFCDCVTAYKLSKQNSKELKWEITYEGLSSTLTIAASACILYAPDETVKLSALLLETLVAVSIFRNSYGIACDAIRFLADKTKTWASFYQDADPLHATLLGNNIQNRV